MKTSLKERLYNWFKSRPGMWIASGDLQRTVGATTTYTPSNVSRRLRELENDGSIEVQYVKSAAQYKFKGIRQITRPITQLKMKV